ncbi:mitochondrial import inner membrane translocase subunit Tim10-like [Mytilus galloprovincialis]|uniref:Mitochondrial import inner membrane translocase subunit n=1 Tax=Mytilus galloprovincialis TaxID=29158 RepID=A0A8B6CF67_MYTGA|nr:mitochondrial import inner membrane translocase subunit TIM10 [Mytilus galloprovincialis]
MATPSLNEAQLKLVSDLELEMMADMYNRMTTACQKKCVPPKYNEADLSKGESVCLDRCVSKYLEMHDNIGKKLTSMSQQDEATVKKIQDQMQPQKS